MARNIKIEVIRLLACFLVIWYHIRQLPWKVDGTLSETAVFFECICTVCVMAFFLITGFFIYNKKGNILNDWKELLIKTFKVIFIPFIIVVIFTIIFHEFLISRATFIDCILKFDLMKILKTLWEATITYSATKLPGTAAHLWYVFSYIVIVVFYPLTRLVLTKCSRKIVYILLFILTICMIVNDYFLFFGNPTYNIVFKILHKPIYYSAWGFVLYNDIIVKYIDNIYIGVTNRPFILNKPIFVSSFITYVITFILLLKTQVAYYLGHNGEYVYTSWLSTYSLILTTAFILFIYSMDIERFINEKLKTVILFITKRSLYIYLLHYLVITKFLSLGFQEMVFKNRPSIINHFLYYIFYGLFIFIVTMLILLLIENILKVFKLGGQND